MKSDDFRQENLRGAVFGRRQSSGMERIGVGSAGGALFFLPRSAKRRLSAFGTVAQADSCGGYSFGKQVKLVSGKPFCCLNLDKVVRGKITIGRIALVKAVREN